MAEKLVLEPKGVYTRSQIHSLIGGQLIGPISAPSAFRVVLLFLETENPSMLEKGVWSFNGEPNEGLSMSRNNRLIMEHKSKGKYLLVFVLKPNQAKEKEYAFVGVAVYRSHEVEGGVVVFSMQLLKDLNKSERRTFEEESEAESGGAVVLFPNGGVSITLYKTKYSIVSREDFGIPKVEKKSRKKTAQNETPVSKEEVESCFERLNGVQLNDNSNNNNNNPLNDLDQQTLTVVTSSEILPQPSNDIEQTDQTTETKAEPEESEEKSVDTEDSNLNIKKKMEKKKEKKGDKGEHVDTEKKTTKRRKITLDQNINNEIQDLPSGDSPFIQIIDGQIVFPSIPLPDPDVKEEKSIPRGGRCLGKSNKFVGQSGRFIFNPEKKIKGKEKEKTSTKTKKKSSKPSTEKKGGKKKQIHKKKKKKKKKKKSTLR
eukprot:TRINITY_DN1552_c0_g2_i1.p1 TRINITY_DN1552_c0_g2~~TRINITY_DN1552_c0_g2_i1.p1  ORF type:complete len:428 (+),score=124.33 TRINITY_DN1552_c0_g2_i1:231-1514(+)